MFSGRIHLWSAPELLYWTLRFSYVIRKSLAFHGHVCGEGNIHDKYWSYRNFYGLVIHSEIRPDSFNNFLLIILPPVEDFHKLHIVGATAAEARQPPDYRRCSRLEDNASSGGVVVSAWMWFGHLKLAPPAFIVERIYWNSQRHYPSCTLISVCIHPTERARSSWLCSLCSMHNPCT